MILDGERLRSSLDELTGQQAPPSAFSAGEAIVRGRRLARRRRLTRGSFALGAGLAAVLALALIPAHLTGPSTAATGAAAPPLDAADPLTLSGTFGWLPANAPNVGYSLHSGQLSAVARGPVTDPGGPANTAMIWLTIYPAGEVPKLGTFADGTPQLRVAAPDVNGHSAYWVTGTASDPTDAGDSYLRWQDADGRWGELHAYYLGDDDVTSTMLRIAAGVDFAPHAVPLPLRISGLPSGVTANEADLNRPDLTVGGSWQVYLALVVRGTMVEITVTPISKAHPTGEGNPGSKCKQQDGLTGCVAVTGAAAGSASEILANLTLLGTDPAGWTSTVIVH